MTQTTVVETTLSGMKLLGRGKVRDIYEVDGKLLLVASDRLSAFDVVMPDGIPGKGKVLTQISAFWFRMLSDIVPNHMISIDVDDFPAAARAHAETLRGRSMLCRKAKPFPIECVVRGYLSGSGWAEYREKGEVCGIPLPKGLRESDRLPEPIFTPATKEEKGHHDENITFDRMVRVVGKETAEKVRSIAVALYSKAAEYAKGKGILIADTKFADRASRRGRTRKSMGEIPLVCRASISSLTCMVPILAAKEAPVRPAMMIPVMMAPMARTIPIPTRSATKIWAPNNFNCMAPTNARIKPTSRLMRETMGRASALHS